MCGLSAVHLHQSRETRTSASEFPCGADGGDQGDPRRVSVKHRQIECVDLFCSTPIKKISKKSGTAKRRVRLGQAAAPSASPRPHALRGSDGRTPLGSATGTNGVGNTEGAPRSAPAPSPGTLTMAITLSAHGCTEKEGPF